MIIDSHYHLFWEGSDPYEWFLGLARVGVEVFGRETGEYGDPVELFKGLMPMLSDQTGDKLVAEMDKANIDVTVLAPLDFWLMCPTTTETHLTIEKKNEIYAKAVEKYPEKLISLVGVDPRRKDALKLFKKGIEEWGMKGLKLHPTAGFYPHDPACYPLYEKAQEYDVPVLVHTGGQPAPGQARYAQPIHIDTVASLFPDVKIIMAHMAFGSWREAIDLATMKPNLYFDFSAWQSHWNSNPDYLYYPLRTAIDMLGPWRVLFGTDGAVTNLILPPENWVNAIRNYDSPSGITFTDNEIEIMLGKAAAKLYKIG